MKKPLCAVDECSKPARARGWCHAHYKRWQQHGSPTAGNPRGIRVSPGIPEAFVAQALSSERDDCILWPYATKQGGYGKIRRGLVTHIVCEAVHGPRPSPRHLAAHNCQTPACINPRHLRWATHKENSADMLMHGTRLLGERVNGVKLTAADVVAIRSQPHRSLSDLAREYAVSVSNISVIRLRLTWRHLP